MNQAAERYGRTFRTGMAGVLQSPAETVNGMRENHCLDLTVQGSAGTGRSKVSPVRVWPETSINHGFLCFF
jgi:hypothetical protein